MAVIGIDLGTTNSLAAVFRNGKAELIPNQFGFVTTPSVVSVDTTGEILVGQSAKERLISCPELSAASFKRRIGSEQPVLLGTREFLPEELSALVLRKLKEDAERYLGEEITEAVISVPAYFNDNQRYATKAAAKLAGLKADRLVNEPSAAALAHRLDQMQKDICYLVFDFGGGTLDVSIVECFENVIEIIAVAGDNHLGGNDFDQLIAEEFCRQKGLNLKLLKPAKRVLLYKKAEETKQQLSKTEEAELIFENEGTLHRMTVSRQGLLELSAPLLIRIKSVINRALNDARKKLSEIDEILLAGGSCKMPIIQEYLTYLSGKKAVCLGDPATLVAQGLGVYAGIKTRDIDIKDMMMTDVCPFTLGIAVKNDPNEQRTHMATMIQRNSVLPACKKDTFYTLYEEQEEVRLAIFQGEGYFTSENLFLGEVMLSVPKAPKGEESVEVTFSYDINGILELEAVNPTSGNKVSKVILSKNSKLTENEIEEKRKELAELKLLSGNNEELRYLSAKGERLYAEAGEEYREVLGRCLSMLADAAESNSPSRLHKTKQYVTEAYEKIESQMNEDWTGIGFKMLLDWNE